MRKTILVGLMAAAGAFAGVFAVGSKTEAADEIRCRVNAAALVQDLAAIGARSGSTPGAHHKDRDELEKLLSPKQ